MGAVSFAVLAVAATLCSLGADVIGMETHHMREEKEGPVEASVRAYVPQWLASSKFKGGSMMRSESGHRQIRESDTDFYGQSKEDEAALHHYFHNRYNGVFLEMGALDGHTFSNTLFYEEKRGWRGLLIEPNVEVGSSLPLH